MAMMFCRGCGKEIHETAISCPQCGAQQGGVVAAAIPEGVKGWSWGAFLLNWIWAIGNKTWIGLLALIPYVGFVMAIVLGFKGREWAWENNKWDSVEHFNRVQKRWSFWAVTIILGVMGVGILAAIAIPAYSDYVKKSKAVAAGSAASYKSGAYYSNAELAKVASEINKTLPMMVDGETQLDTTIGTDNMIAYHYTLVNYDSSALDGDSFKSILIENGLVRKVCSTPETYDNFISKGVEMRYSYFGNDGKFVTGITVKPSMCDI